VTGSVGAPVRARRKYTNNARNKKIRNETDTLKDHTSTKGENQSASHGDLDR
jgi:hypothetical protein